jgi:predicted metal-dependent hydrolase
LIERCSDPPPPELLLGIEQFNQREYFECHETLEALWNREPGTIRVLAKGILQVGVGCYHLLRGNHRGALLRLASGADYLEPFAPRCRHVDVAQLIADAWRLHAEVTALGPERLGEIDHSLLPIIRLASDAAPLA